MTHQQADERARISFAVVPGHSHGGDVVFSRFPLEDQDWFRGITLSKVAGDYWLTLNLMGPDGKLDLPFASCGFRFRNPGNGGGTLPHSFRALHILMNCLEQAAKAPQGTTTEVVINLPPIWRPIDQGPGWLGLATDDVGRWWVMAAPHNGVRIGEPVATWGERRDCGLLLTVPLDLPQILYRGLLCLYEGMRIDERSPRTGGAFT